MTAWRRRAVRPTFGDRCVRSGGVVAEIGPQGRPCAVALFRQDPDMHFGRVLLVQHFVVASLSLQDEIARALGMCLESEAIARGCGAIRTVLSSKHGSGTHTTLLTMGFRPDDVVLLKPLT